MMYNNIGIVSGKRNRKNKNCRAFLVPELFFLDLNRKTISGNRQANKPKTFLQGSPRSKNGQNFRRH